MSIPIKALLAILMMLGASLPAGAATFSVKRGVNLDVWITWPTPDTWGDRDAILPFPEWRKTLKPEDLEALKADGFDFVRMPVDPAPFLTDAAAPLEDDLFASVLESARMVNAAGLKVIVDVHAMPSGGARPLGTGEILADPALFERYVGLVRRMAHTLSKEDPKAVALELMNEPITGCDGAEARAWTGQLKRLFAAARASATRLTLVLGGACWGNAEGLAALDPRAFPDDNLMWDVHSYDPFVLTHQGASWAGDFIRYVTGLPFPPSSVPRVELDAAVERIKERIDAEAPLMRRSGMKTYLDELIAQIDTPEKLSEALDKPFASVAGWAAKYGIDPKTILLGEFGMIRQEYGTDAIVPAATRAAYIRQMIDHAEAHGFAWSIWSYGGPFGIVESFEGRKVEPGVVDMIRALPR